MAGAPTRQQILQLYRNYLNTAQSFVSDMKTPSSMLSYMLILVFTRTLSPQSSYNFRTYFLRRSRDLFRSNLLPASQANYASPFSKASGLTTPVSPPTMASPTPSVLLGSGSTTQATTDEDRVRVFYETAKRDLDVLKRAAFTNRMYEGERLVVEKPVLIVGGGGAGAEAAVGGGAPHSNAKDDGGVDKRDK